MPMDVCSTSAPTVQEPIKPKMTSGRKSSKPLMEKRRRARINDSLGQLKSLILEATNKDSSRHSKLEKADILEMTVKYLRNMQRHQITASGNTDPAILNRYRQGYRECINKVSRYLDSSDSAVQLRTQLIDHLANTVTAAPVVSQHQPHQTIAYPPAPTPAPTVTTAAIGSQPTSTAIKVQISPSSITSVPVPTKVENASNVAAAAVRTVSGIPVGVPGGINGEITVVLPPQALPGGQLPSHFIPVYAQRAPCLLSPTSSTTSSQCLASPTSSVETPTTPTHQQTQYVSYQQLASKQELTSPVSYQHQQIVPQSAVYMSYYPGNVSTSSPLVGSVAPTVATTVQHVQAPPTFVAMPANVLTSAAEPNPATQHHPHSHHLTVSQPHLYHQSSPKTVLRTVNINVQQQQPCVVDENVWRPW